MSPLPRRGVLAATLAAPLAASVVLGASPSLEVAEAPNPDAALIEKAADFIAFHRHKEEAISHLHNKNPAEWTPADRAAWESSLASNTEWDEDVEEISAAEPTTREGLIAQAEVVLFLHLYDGDDQEGALAWNFAESVLRVLGHPMPGWACVEQCEGTA